MRREDGLTDDPEKLERGWKNFLAAVLVDARNECGWLTRNLSDEFLRSASDHGFCRNRLMSAASHWRWVFGDGGGALEFTEACDELGLDANSARNRIIAHCAPCPGINRMVNAVLSWESL